MTVLDSNRGVRVCLIGFGAMGRLHLDLWGSIPGATVTAVVDAAAGEGTSHTSGGVPVFRSLEAALEEAHADAVDICTPSGLHAAQAIAAANRGLHVLTEKPAALRLADMDAAMDCCQRNGVLFATLFQRRAHPACRKLAADIHSGVLGRPISCSGSIKWHRPQSYYDAAEWRGTVAMDGGVLANQAIHIIDQLCWLAGRVEEVEYANLSPTMHDIEAEDNAIVVLRFESGARGVLEATTCCNPDFGSRVEIFGERGAVRLRDAQVTEYGVDGEDRLHELGAQEGITGGGSSATAIDLSGHRILFCDFVDAAKNGGEPMVPAAEARKSIEALELIYRKAGVY